MKVDVKKPEQVFDLLNLKEHSVYKVRVKHKANNPEHEAILFTGFKCGNYCEVYNNSYDTATSMMDLYSMKIIRFLTELK